MRVLHFAESFSLVSETFIYNQVTELEQQGVDNHVLTLHRVNPEVRPFPKVYVVDRPSRWHPRRLWHRLQVQGKKRASPISFWPQVRDRLEQVVREVQPEIVHAQFGPAGVLVGPVAKKNGVPLVVSFHGYDVSILAQKEFWTRRYKDMFSQVDAIHAVSSDIADKVEKLGGSPDSIRVVHNGIDVNKFWNQVPDIESDPNGSIRCLHVGRLVEKKAPIHLLRAFREARSQIEYPSDLELVIAGDGPLRCEAEKEASRLSVADAVSFKGQVPHHAVPRLMRSSDIYTMHCMTASNGDQEGMGVTFAEASAMGLPIVTTRHNGIPEVVVDGITGYLVPEGDVEEMGKKITELARKKKLRRRFGENGQRYIEENFELEKQTEKIRKLYAELAKGY